MSEGGLESIRVMVVDDIAETRENIRKLLQFESDIEVIGSARTGQEALELAPQVEPDVVLMDINMPDMDGITVTETLLEEVPYAQVVMLSVQSEADYMRRAMLAGARDFIAKPPSGDELIRTIRIVAERAREQKEKLSRPLPEVHVPGTAPFSGGTGKLQGKQITLYSAKGGVGCTMLATNLALGLHTEETPAVLVDASLQFGDVSVFMNLQAKTSMIDLTTRADELDTEYIHDVLMIHESGLKVLPAPQRPEMADEVRADQVRKVLAFLKNQFAYTIVDTSSTMDDVSLAVLDTSDLLVTVATPEIPAIKDLRLLMDLLSVLDYPRDQVFFALNKVDRKTGISAEAIAENLKREIDVQIPLEEQVVGQSINRGVPVLMGDKSKVPARNLLDLVGTIRQKLVERPEDEAEGQGEERARLFGR